MSGRSLQSMAVKRRPTPIVGVLLGTVGVLVLSFFLLGNGGSGQNQSFSKPAEPTHMWWQMRLSPRLIDEVTISSAQEVWFWSARGPFAIFKFREVPLNLSVPKGYFAVVQTDTSTIKKSESGIYPLVGRSVQSCTLFKSTPMVASWSERGEQVFKRFVLKGTPSPHISGKELSAGILTSQNEFIEVQKQMRLTDYQGSKNPPFAHTGSENAVVLTRPLGGSMPVNIEGGVYYDNLSEQKPKASASHVIVDRLYNREFSFNYQGHRLSFNIVVEFMHPFLLQFGAHNLHCALVMAIIDLWDTYKSDQLGTILQQQSESDEFKLSTCNATYEQPYSEASPDLKQLHAKHCNACVAECHMGHKWRRQSDNTWSRVGEKTDPEWKVCIHPKFIGKIVCSACEAPSELPLKPLVTGGRVHESDSEFAISPHLFHFAITNVNVKLSMTTAWGRRRLNRDEISRIESFYFKGNKYSKEEMAGGQKMCRYVKKTGFFSFPHHSKGQVEALSFLQPYTMEFQPYTAEERPWRDYKLSQQAASGSSITADLQNAAPESKINALRITTSTRLVEYLTEEQMAIFTFWAQQESSEESVLPGFWV